jgi:hypothetical protein
MRPLLLLTLATHAFADDRVRILRFVDSALELPPPEREKPKVKVRIEPAPARPKSSRAGK